MRRKPRAMPSRKAKVGRKTASRASPRSPSRRSSIPVIPAMRGFSFLTGDVNWREYGATFYRSFGDGTYALIEFVNVEEDMGAPIHGNRYLAVGKTVDISPGGFSLKSLSSALRSAGVSSTPRNPEMILDALNGYGAYDVDFEIYGNNANQLMAEAKRYY